MADTSDFDRLWDVLIKRKGNLRSLSLKDQDGLKELLRSVSGSISEPPSGLEEALSAIVERGVERALSRMPTSPRAEVVRDTSVEGLVVNVPVIPFSMDDKRMITNIDDVPVTTLTLGGMDSGVEKLRQLRGGKGHKK